MRVGLNAGEPIEGEGDLFGTAVQRAARICAQAEPGQILAPIVVRGLARTSAGVRFEERGEHELKGVSEPMRVWAVGD